MRKLMLSALLMFALTTLIGAGDAWAGDCGCKKSKCSSGCKVKSTCGKSKCGGCDTCKPKCSKPKCGGCDTCKPKCGSCKDKCSCGPVYPKGSPAGGQWVECLDACDPPTMVADEICVETWDPCVADACGQFHHPYEQVYNGSGMLCDTGCCGTYLPCKRKGVVCRTECKEVSCTDGCGCKHVSYEYETTCEELKRPRVIPWWFNEAGPGNIYLDENGDPLCGERIEKEQPAPPAAEERREMPQVTPPPAPPVRTTPVTPPPPAPPAEVIQVPGNG
jgi:hypothetical protein